MSRRRSRARRQWAVAALLGVALVAGLACVFFKLFAHTFAHRPVLPWTSLSDSDRAAVTAAVGEMYAPLTKAKWSALASHVTPPPSSAAADDAILWWVRQLRQRPTQARTNWQKCGDQIQALGWAVEQWTADRDDADLPPSLDALVPTYFKTLPVCPQDGTPYRYQCSQKTGQFTITCPGSHHRLAGGANDAPEYSSRYGLQRLEQPSNAGLPQVAAFTIQSIERDGSQAICHIQEQVDGQSLVSTVTLEQVGAVWKAVLPDAHGVSLPADHGVLEQYLEALVAAPAALAGASASSDNLSSCGKQLRAVGAALDAWASDHRNQYPARLQDLVPHYLRVLPRCPVDDGAYTYQCQGTDYTLSCEGGRHTGCHVPDGYPRISSTTGLLLAPAPATAALR